MPEPALSAEFYTVREIAQKLRIGEQQAYATVHRGEVRAVKIGGSYRVPAGELERLQRGEPLTDE